MLTGLRVPLHSEARALPCGDTKSAVRPARTATANDRKGPRAFVFRCRHNTGDKLRASNTLTLVSFIPLLGGVPR